MGLLTVMEGRTLRYIGIGSILLLSAFLHFARLGQEGFANLYYAAGVKSMLQNWHNFFFVSFDPGGFITIDKPPLGFWLQALSAKLFGFQGWSLILPQALGGVLSVYLLYVIVKRYHGVWTGLLAALVLALTPIFVAASRNNTIDGLLVVTLLVAVRVFLPATEELNLKKLSLAFFLIGVGFNIKSLEAFLILPAFYITYLFTRQGDFRKKAVHLAVATAVLVLTSLPWFIAVDSITPENRPYVGSSESNSELELATGYNGLGHFLGYGVRVPGRPGRQMPGNFVAGVPGINAPTPGAGPGLSGGVSPSGVAAAQPAGNGRMGGGETGPPGLFRLFNRQMGGQISWLLPLALLAVVLALHQYRRQTLSEESRMKLLFWSSWLLPQLVFFSVAQGAHRYYLVMMAPAIAALVGICYNTLADWASGKGRKRFILPAAVVLAVGVQALLAAGYEEWRSWMLPTLIGTGLIAGLAQGWLAMRGDGRPAVIRRLAVGAGIVALLIAPLAWSLTPVLYGSANAAFPFAGPDLNPAARQANPAGGMPNLFGRLAGVDTGRLVQYVIDHSGGEKYLIAVPNARIASPIILDTGRPVMTYGGFMGSEKIITAEKLADMVADRQLRYIMITSGYVQQPEVVDWVTSHGVLVPDAEWQPLPTSASAGAIPSGPRLQILRLYDCQPPIGL
ncbi:MAG: glycosyltransferase family 39 protein [Negativicutes bacterium]|nr:glycosyltransferase family 39 protein [Negativicutes bacterium]